MRYFLLISFLAISTILPAQRKKNQIGMRIGDPIGVTFKTFRNEKTAFEFILATAGENWNRSYHEESFIHEYYEDVPDVEYQSSTQKNVLYVQARYLSHSQIIWAEIPGTWEWFWGIGIVAKTAELKYQYNQYAVIDDKYYTYELESKVRDYDVGPEGVVGVQYSFKDLPLTIGYEFSLLTEFYDRAPAFRGLTGLVFRYSF
jgi:hypothetical protein